MPNRSPGEPRRWPSSRASRCPSRRSLQRWCGTTSSRRVEDISDRGSGIFEVRIGLAAATTGNEPGQIMNMLFGNASILDDVTLVDAVFPAAMIAGAAGTQSRHCRSEVAGAGRPARLDVLGAQAPGTEPARAREPCRRHGRGRSRLHQGRSWPRRPALQPLCRAGGSGGRGHPRHRRLPASTSRASPARSTTSDTALPSPATTALPPSWSRR